MCVCVRVVNIYCMSEHVKDKLSVIRGLEICGYDLIHCVLSLVSNLIFLLFM